MNKFSHRNLKENMGKIHNKKQPYYLTKIIKIVRKSEEQGGLQGDLYKK